MAEQTGSSGNTLIALIVGGLLVLAVGFFALGGNLGSKNIDVNVKAPAVTSSK